MMMIAVGGPHPHRIIDMANLDGKDDQDDDHALEEDGNAGVHLPLHIQVMEAEEEERPMTTTSTTKSIISNDENSACTNPHLQQLMEQYFPSDDEGVDCGCDADNESIERHLEKTPRTKRRKASRRRRRSSCLGLGLANKYSTEEKALPAIDIDLFHQHMSMEDNAPHPLKAKSCDAIVQQGDFEVTKGDEDYDAEEDFEWGVVRKTTRNRFSRFNAWDSSPSTVCEDDAADAARNHFFHPIVDDSDVRKNLFANDAGEDLNLTPDHNITGSLVDSDEDDPVLDSPETNDSDLELTKRSRQLQYDLRLQEMTELALEAERAAEAGEEKFVGSATRFELGLGLDVRDALETLNEQYSPPRILSRYGGGPPGWPSCRPFDCGRPLQDGIITPQRAHTQRHILGRRPVTELSKQRPRPLSARFRQASAPTTMQSSQALTAPPISTMPSILTSRTFLSSPPAVKKEKIPVLALRHMEDVIPSFQSMHPNIRTHMTNTCGVKHEMLSRAINRVPAKKGGDKAINIHHLDDPLSRGLKGAGSNSGSSFLTRVPSFTMIMKTVSGLSGSDLVVRQTSDDDLSFDGSKTSKDSDTNLSIESIIPMDCVSFVSCGERSDKMLALTPVRPSKQPTVVDIMNRDKSTPQDKPTDIYACTLATELLDPRQERRPVSPPPEAPYNMDVTLVDLSPRRGASFCVRTPRSRWSTFWDNISPTKRHLSLPKRLTLGTPYLPSITNSKPFHSSELHARKPALLPFGDENDKPFYLKPLGTGRVEDWGVTQKDDTRNDFVLPIESLPQSRPSCDSNTIHNEHLINSESHAQAEALEGKSAEDEACTKEPYAKESFRTSTTSHLSGDDESFSDISQVSKPNKTNIPSALTVYNVSSLEEAASETNEMPSNPFVTRDQDSATDKPPLHPAGVRLANILLTKTSSFRKIKKELLELPTIEASIPDIDDGDSKNRQKPDQSSGQNAIKLIESNDFTECNLKSFDAIEEKKSDTDVSYDSEKICNSKKPSGYFWSSNGFDRDDQSFCEEPQDTVPQKVITNSQSTTKSLDLLLLGDMNSNSFPDDEDTNNKSSLSFINLMEKVPSVIGRLRFGKSKDSEGICQNETDFVENYLYTGRKEKKSKNISEKKDNNICRQKEICGKNPRCVDVSCSSMMESAMTCLSVQHSVSYEVPYDSTVYDRNPKKCVLNSFGLPESVKVGDFVFQGPSLKYKTSGELLLSGSLESNDNSSFAE